MMPFQSGTKHQAKEAILFTSWADRDESDLRLDTPNLLLPLMGRTVLQRALEQLVRLGCLRVRVVLGAEASRIRDFLQSGERWGCRLSFHYLSPHGTFGAFMRSLDVNTLDDYWLADAAQLPDITSTALDEHSQGRAYLFWNRDGRHCWSGWGYFSGAWLLSRRIGLTYAALEKSIASDERLMPHLADRPLSAKTLADVLTSSQRLLATTTELPVIGRGGNIHPSATIIPPVWIGEHVKIGAKTAIGPGAIIGSGSFIDEGTHVLESAVMPDTYVGKGLDLRHGIAQGGLLANIPLDTVVALQDADLLVSLKGRTAVMPIDRLAATTLSLGLFPLYAAIRMGFPKTGSRRWLKHFRDTFYPGLREVMAGRLSVVGPTADSPSMSGRVPASQRRHHGRPRLGLLNDALFSDEPEYDPDVLLASNMLAMAWQGKWRATIMYLRRYLGQVLRDLCTTMYKRPNCSSPATR